MACQIKKCAKRIDNKYNKYGSLSNAENRFSGTINIFMGWDSLVEESVSEGGQNAWGEQIKVARKLKERMDSD